MFKLQGFGPKADALAFGKTLLGGSKAQKFSGRSTRFQARSQQSGDSGESAESLFMKELKKRGLSTSRDPAPVGRSATTEERPPPPPMFTEEPRPSQLEKSRALNSEGLEGLIPRATELVKLGGAFFLAFGPLILVISLLFSAIFLVYGEAFVHGGRAPHSGERRYLDPYELLMEPTVDPTIPFNP